MSRSAHNPRRLTIQRKLLFALLPGVLLLLLLLTAAEIALRLHYEKIDRITGVAAWETETRPGVISYLWDQYHPRYGWTSLPGYNSDDRVPFQVSISEQGLRGGRVYDEHPPQGVTRIAMFGDSCTFGEEVGDDGTVPAYLERHFENLEVINFGVRAFGLGQMAMRLEDEGFAMNPDHVLIMAMLPGNIRRDLLPYFAHNKPVFGVDDQELTVSNVPVPEASRQPWLHQHCFVAAWLFGRPKEKAARGATQDEQLGVAHAILRRVIDQCRHREIPVTLIGIVAPPNIRKMQEGGAYLEAMQEMRSSLGDADIDMLDLVGELERAYLDEGDPLAAPLGHWSPRGNCLIAREIARHLVRSDPGFRMRLDKPTCYADVDQP